MLRRAGPGVGLAIHLDRTDGRHGGSDYRSFALEHVPFVRFFGNFFPDYHEPGDTAERLDPAQVQRLARFCFATAWLLAARRPACPMRGRCIAAAVSLDWTLSQPTEVGRMVGVPGLFA